MTNYDIAKQMYLQGKSLRAISLELKIDRHTLSKKLKKDNIVVKKGIIKEDFEKACELYKKGKNVTTIASELKLDRHTLSKEFEKNNVRDATKRHKRNESNDEAILDLYSKNLSINSIAKKLNISTNAVWNTLRSYYQSLEKTCRKYNLNENVFEKIDTEEKAYWLGFLYADGYVNEDKGIELALKEEDFSHIQKFANFLETDAPIKQRFNAIGNKQFINYRLTVTNKKISNDLTRLGCTQAKSLTLEFPVEEQVPRHLIHHFMRGYFDGDGAVVIVTPAKGNGKKPQLATEILGTKEFLEKYDKYLIDLGVNNNKYRTHGSAFGIRHGGNKQVDLIFKFLYSNATIFLERKHAKFIAVLGSNA